MFLITSADGDIVVDNKVTVFVIPDDGNIEVTGTVAVTVASSE